MPIPTILRRTLSLSTLFAISAWAAGPTSPGMPTANEHQINPEFFYLHPDKAFPESAPNSTFSDLWDRSQIVLNGAYYGRARTTQDKQDQIHVNAFGLGVDFVSGYAWDTVGFDLGANTNVGRGNGWSEVLRHDVERNTDRSFVGVNQAALKMKLGDQQQGFEARGGLTPIRVGTMGTGGGLSTHAYRGFELKGHVGDLEIGYGWADKFRNEWTNSLLDMTNSWTQNRHPFQGTAQNIDYAHSIGAIYKFGYNKEGLIDAGYGQGKDFRTNAQVLVAYPIHLPETGTLTLTGYGIWGKYKEKLTDFTDPKNEYHISASAELKTNDWTFLAAIGQTYAPDSGEMFYRVTPWANSDARNFTQTWAQLDDFVWNREKGTKLAVNYDLGKHISLPGLSIGANFNYGWNIHVPNQEKKGTSWEIDGNIRYVVPSGSLKGMYFGIYPGYLRTSNTYLNGYGKQDRDDIRVVVGYSYVFDMAKRNKQ